MYWKCKKKNTLLFTMYDELYVEYAWDSSVKVWVCFIVRNWNKHFPFFLSSLSSSESDLKTIPDNKKTNINLDLEKYIQTLKAWDTVTCDRMWLSYLAKLYLAPVLSTTVKEKEKKFTKTPQKWQYFQLLRLYRDEELGKNVYQRWRSDRKSCNAA